MIEGAAFNEVISKFSIYLVGIGNTRWKTYNICPVLGDYKTGGGEEEVRSR